MNSYKPIMFSKMSVKEKQNKVLNQIFIGPMQQNINKYKQVNLYTKLWKCIFVTTRLKTKQKQTNKQKTKQIENKDTKQKKTELKKRNKTEQKQSNF